MPDRLERRLGIGTILAGLASPGAGSVHDKKAKWIWGVLDELEKADLVTLADKGHQGSTWAKAPNKGKGKPEPQKQANRAHARLAPASERTRSSRHGGSSASSAVAPAGKLAKAIHVLQTREA